MDREQIDYESPPKKEKEPIDYVISLLMWMLFLLTVPAIFGLAMYVVDLIKRL